MPAHQWTQSVASQWGIFLPPARPSLSELAKIERILLEKKINKPELRVGVLGSTPEYRDLCRTHDINYFCIDYSKNNFAELRAYMLHKDDGSHLLEADWLVMDFEETFDVILGDLATTVTNVADHGRMFKNIADHLAQDGVGILKTPLREDNTQLSHGEIFELYRSERSHLNPFAAVWIEVLLADYDFENDTMYCKESDARLAESCEKGIITEFEYGEFKKRWDVLGDFKMNIPLRETFLEKLNKHVRCINFEHTSDWYSGQAPLVSFAKA